MDLWRQSRQRGRFWFLVKKPNARTIPLPARSTRMAVRMVSIKELYRRDLRTYYTAERRLVKNTSDYRFR